MPRLRDVLEFIKVEHSLFALPFVLAGFVLGLRQVGTAVAPTVDVLATLGFLIVAAVAARTGAMVINRIIDRHLDARNPRTATRHLPAGRLTTTFAWALAAASLAVMVVASAALNPVCLYLSPILVALFVAYPYMKRVTWGCHFVLGLVFLCAPAGGYLAVTGSFAGWVTPFFVGVAAMTWVAGFDVIYALLDVDHDVREGVHSIPARFGVPAARVVSRTLHAATVVSLLVTGVLLAPGNAYWVGLLAVGGLLAYEHATVDPTDVAAINKAFFSVNAVVGWVAFAGLLGGLLL